ncbi:MAG: hypothetical protein RID91_16100 [Azospirillaceae bacterium]
MPVQVKYRGKNITGTRLGNRASYFLRESGIDPRSERARRFIEVQDAVVRQRGGYGAVAETELITIRCLAGLVLYSDIANGQIVRGDANVGGKSLAMVASQIRAISRELGVSVPTNTIDLTAEPGEPPQVDVKKLVSAWTEAEAAE